MVAKRTLATPGQTKPRMPLQILRFQPITKKHVLLKFPILSKSPPRLTLNSPVYEPHRLDEARSTTSKVPLHRHTTKTPKPASKVKHSFISSSPIISYTTAYPCETHGSNRQSLSVCARPPDIRGLSTTLTDNITMPLCGGSTKTSM